MVALARAKHLQTASSTSQAAKSSSGGLLEEDDKILAFLNRLNETSGATATVDQQTDDQDAPEANTDMAAAINSSTTVPAALTRRVLNRQGVGYIPGSHVDTMVSLAADHFLASVLQQAIICQRRRLEGEAMIKKDRNERREEKVKRRNEKITVAKARRDDWRQRQKTAEQVLKNLEAPPASAPGSASVGSTSKSKKKLKKGDKDKDKKDAGSVASNKKSKKSSSKREKAIAAAIASVTGDAPEEEVDKDEEKKGDDFLDSEWLEWGDGSVLEELSDLEEESDDDDDEGVKIQDVVRSVQPFGIELPGKFEMS